MSWVPLTRCARVFMRGPYGSIGGLATAQAIITDEHAAIAFDVTLFNSGSGPARDVIVEACMINVGKQQERQLADFYQATADERNAIPVIAPLSRVSLKSAVRLPRGAVQEFVVGGRKLFMPMVAINVLYRWSSGQGQTAVSFLVGRGEDGAEKLKPIRLDHGPGGWKKLAARPYERGIRR